MGCAQANVYELDSVFLHDFAINKKIQPLPPAAMLPDNGFLKNAVAGAVVGGVHYGPPHWVCGNFLCFAKSDLKMQGLKTIQDLKKAIGAHPASGGGLAVDLMEKSTLGEFYLNAASTVIRIGTMSPRMSARSTRVWKVISLQFATLQQKTCRDSNQHQTAFFAEQFGAKRARALIGYSESLNGALKLATDKGKCPMAAACLVDSDIDVEELPLDSHAPKVMSWVDSSVVDKKCTDQCLADAAEFIRFMDDDDLYMSILLPQDGVPAYLLPATPACNLGRLTEPCAFVSKVEIDY